jgi:hypothetical protein
MESITEEKSEMPIVVEPVVVEPVVVEPSAE